MFCTQRLKNTLETIIHSFYNMVWFRRNLPERKSKKVFYMYWHIFFFFSLPISKSVCSRRLLKYCFFCLTLFYLHCSRLHSQHNSLACTSYKEDTSEIFFKMRFFLLLHLWDIEFKLDLGHIQAIFHEIGSKYSILHVL